LKCRFQLKQAERKKLIHCRSTPDFGVPMGADLDGE